MRIVVEALLAALAFFFALGALIAAVVERQVATALALGLLALACGWLASKMRPHIAPRRPRLIDRQRQPAAFRGHRSGLIDPPEAVEVEQDGRWCSGQMLACSRVQPDRSLGGWRCFVHYTIWPGQGYVTWVPADRVRPLSGGTR